MKAFFCTLFVYLSTVYRYFWLYNRQARKLFKNSSITIDGKKFSLDDAVVKRMKLYYLMSKLSMRWLCVLRGFKASKTETLCMFYFGAITPLIDDLNDSFKLTSLDIKKILKTNHESLHETVPLIRKLYFKLEKNCSKKFLEVFDEALTKQDESIKQIEDEKLDDEKLIEISYEKGGIFVFLYRLILEQQLQKGEDAAIYQLGYVIQLLNDMFDTYKDHTNKQQTLFTNTTNMELCKKEFMNSIEKMKNLFLELNYKKNDIKRSLLEIATFTSMGKVCVQQFIQCQEQTNHQFQIEKYGRKQLVCDMEKWSNRYKSFKFCMQEYRQLSAIMKLKK